MFDQAGLVREMVEWEYELRDGIQTEDLVDRALTIAMSEPRGPVYLALPREVLAEPTPDLGLSRGAGRQAGRAGAHGIRGDGRRRLSLRQPGGVPSRFAAFLREENVKWTKAVKETNVRLE
jgi:hypothetical protein